MLYECMVDGQEVFSIEMTMLMELIPSIECRQ